MNYKAKKSWSKHWDFIVIDMLCLQLAFVFAYWLRHGVQNPYIHSVYRNEVLVLVLVQFIVAYFSENFKNVLGAFMGAEDRVFNEIAPNVLELAMEIATKIIKHEVQTDPQIVIDTVMDVMRTLSKNEPEIILRINPVQVQYVKDTLPEQIRLLGMETKLSVLSDENISEGGCVIETNNGVVDATVETQLDIVQNALRSIE